MTRIIFPSAENESSRITHLEYKQGIFFKQTGLGSIQTKKKWCRLPESNWGPTDYKNLGIGTPASVS